MKPPTPSKQSLPVLVAGDVLAVLLFVVVGRASHHEDGSWLFNLARIGSPFLLGWFAVAPFTGAYQLPPPRRGLWLRRSALTWLLGIGFGLVLRRFLFRDLVPPTFAVITLIFTGIFLLGWRTVFAVVSNRYRQTKLSVSSAR
ncbi:MAG: DUF3054 domain-containing protein [Herpetosiphonaceae bacterium]|nr:DUF3054 domain-containing protein [Herpetosiphonaceae bacterium]